MANYSRKSASNESQWETYDEDNKALFRALLFGNGLGIKKSQLWHLPPPDRYGYTYFILPDKPGECCSCSMDAIYKGTAPIMDDVFERFWLLLDDTHKERRFLVSYLCTLRSIDDAFSPENPVIPILRKMIAEYSWTLRRLWITERKSGTVQEYRDLMGGLMDVFLWKSANDFMNSHWMKLFKDSCWRAIGDLDAIDARGIRVGINVSRDFFQGILFGFFGMYSYWITLTTPPPNVVNSASNAPNQFEEIHGKRYLSKLRVAVPHWRQQDRKFLHEAMNTTGRRCNITYVGRLLNEIGKDQFEHVAFGIEKFCGNCGRSSHVGPDRLWSCSRCIREGVRHKARYCDVTCQRAHWPIHKARVHSRPSCTNCGKLEKSGDSRLRACSACVKQNVPDPARYCNVECQKADWPKHKGKAHAK